MAKEIFANGNYYIPNDLKLGGQVANFIPVEVLLTDDSSFLAMKEMSMAWDSNGLFRKVNGQREYIGTETFIRQYVATSIINSKQEFFFDPNVDLFPTPEERTFTDANGNETTETKIIQGDYFVVANDGQWIDGGGNTIALKQGDILQAPTDIASATPQFTEFLYNEAASGQTVSSATTAFEGIIKLRQDIPLDGSATHDNTLPTTKAIADMAIALETSLNATIENVRSQLQGQITTNSTAISGLDTRVSATESAITILQTKETEQDSRLDTAENEIDDLQAKEGVQDSRLDALEEWSYQGATITIGDGTTLNYSIPVPIQFKNIDDVSFKLKVADGAGGYRTGVAFGVEVAEESGQQVLKAAFTQAPTQDMFWVRASGLAKPLA